MPKRAVETTAVEACIERYVAQVRADRAEVGTGIREAILAETPEYALLGGEAAVRWAAGIDLAVAMFIEGGIDGRALTPEERAAMEAIGRDRADRGLPLTAIAASIAVAARVVRDWPARRLPTGPDEQLAMTAYSERVTTFANKITDAVLAGYLARTGEQTASLEQARARLFEAIFEGGMDDEAVTPQGAALGCDLLEPWAVALIPSMTGQPIDVLEREVLGVLPGAVVVPRVTATTPHTAFAVPLDPGTTWEAVRAALAAVAEDQKALLLASGPCRGPRQLYRRYRTARILLTQMGRLTEGPELIDTAEHADTALFADVEAEAGVTYADDVLGPIDRLPGSKAWRLHRTLDALVNNDAAPKRAATVTGQSVRTVYRHMHSIEETTGRSFDCFGDVFRFRVAVLLRKMSR